MSLNAIDLTVGTPDMLCTATAPDGSTIALPKTQTTFNVARRVAPAPPANPRTM